MLTVPVHPGTGQSMPWQGRDPRYCRHAHRYLSAYVASSSLERSGHESSSIACRSN